MLRQPVVTAETLQKLRDAESQARFWRAQASAEGIHSIGLETGQIVKDPNTGARYKIVSVTIWIRENDQTPQVSIMGRRTYHRPGRRDAWATTILTGRDYELEV